MAPHNSRIDDRVNVRNVLSHVDGVAIWTGSKADGFAYVSPGYEDIWGRPAETLVADFESFLDGVHPDDREDVAAVVGDADGRLAAGETVEAEHRVVQPSGEVRWVSVRVFPLESEDGPLEVVGVTIDITDRKETEAELEAQKERLDRFASVVAHDMRNPLTTAMGYLELAESVDGDNPYHEPLSEALERMDRLVDDVLSLARPETGSSGESVVELEDAVRTAWMMTGIDGGRLELDDELGAVAVRGTRVRQLFENLFRNAVEHGSTNDTPSEDEGGKTDSDGTVEYGDRSVTVRVGLLDHGTGFYVADDGPGIPRKNATASSRAGSRRPKAGRVSD